MGLSKHGVEVTRDSVGSMFSVMEFVYQYHAGLRASTAIKLFIRFLWQLVYFQVFGLI